MIKEIRGLILDAGKFTETELRLNGVVINLFPRLYAKITKNKRQVRYAYKILKQQAPHLLNT